ncbi:unnamed protein product [Sphagnum balticum]
MAVTGDKIEPWYWQDDCFKLDPESPLVISRSFWEDLTQTCEAESQSLFASTHPIDEIQEEAPAFFYLNSQDWGEDVHSDYTVQYDERCKRRRMLHFTPGGKDDCLGALSAPFEPGNNPDFESCICSVICGCEELLIPSPLSPNIPWHTRSDDISSSLSKSADQLPEKWMMKFKGTNANSSAIEKKVAVPPLPVIDVSEQCLEPSWQSCEAEVLQGPVTPVSKPLNAGRRSSPLSRFKAKVSTPIVYPFALVKPSGAQGDVTLNDINQRILSPPPKPLPQQQPSAVSEDKSPQPLVSGSGLSGKSIVACTKIHTEGNGTITIMRTRG